MRIEGRKYTKAYYNLEKYKAQRPEWYEILLEQFGQAAANTAQAAGTKGMMNVLQTDEEEAQMQAQTGLLKAQGEEAGSKGAYYREKPALERGATEALQATEKYKADAGIKREGGRGASAERQQETAIIPGVLNALREMNELEWKRTLKGEGNPYLKVGIAMINKGDIRGGLKVIESGGLKVPVPSEQPTLSSTQADLDAANNPKPPASGQTPQDRAKLQAQKEYAELTIKLAEMQKSATERKGNKPAGEDTLRKRIRELEQQYPDLMPGMPPAPSAPGGVQGGVHTFKM